MANAYQCLGLALFIAGVLGIFLNEDNLVRNDATADEVKQARDAGCDPSDWENRKLVFASCPVQAPDIQELLPNLLKPLVLDFNGSSVSWSVEIYQWHQERESHESCTKDARGKKTCETYYTYEYDTDWSDEPVDSSLFHNFGYENVGELPSNFANGHASQKEYSVKMSEEGLPGGFVLNKALMNSLPKQNVPFNAKARIAHDWSGHGNLDPSMLQDCGNGYLCTYKSLDPDIGDLRISVTGRNASAASVCAMQIPFDGPMYAFAPFPRKPFDYFGRRTYEIERLEPGIQTKQEFEEEWHSENLRLAWCLRLASLSALVVSFGACMDDMSEVMHDHDCCNIGDLVDGTFDLVGPPLACGCGTSWFILFIALAWLAVHPMWSLGILMLAVGTYGITHFGTLYKRLNHNKQRQTVDSLKKPLTGSSDDHAFHLSRSLRLACVGMASGLALGILGCVVATTVCD